MKKDQNKKRMEKQGREVEQDKVVDGRESNMLANQINQQSEDYLSLLGVQNEESSQQNKMGEVRNVGGKDLWSRTEAMMKQVKVLKQKVWQRQQIITSLEDHNKKIFAEWKTIQNNMETKIHEFQLLHEEKTSQINILNLSLQQKDQKIEKVILTYSQQQKVYQQREKQLTHQLQLVKSNSHSHYEDLLLLKDNQIKQLTSKLSSLQTKLFSAHSHQSSIISQLQQSNQAQQHTINQLHEFITHQQNTLKKMSLSNNELILENQCLKYKFEQWDALSDQKKYMDEGQKYKKLSEVNRKLEEELESILREAEQMKKREIILQMQVEELQEKVNRNWNENNKMSLTQREHRQVGKIKQVRQLSSTKQIQSEGRQRDVIIQLNKRIKRMEEVQSATNKIHEVLIRTIKQKVSAIISFLSTAQNICPQTSLQQIITFLDKFPLTKAAYLRNLCNQCDITNIFTLEEGNSILKKIDHFQHHHKTKKKYSEDEKMWKKTVGRNKKVHNSLRIQIEDNESFDKQLYESLQDTGNVQYDSYFKYD